MKNRPAWSDHPVPAIDIPSSAHDSNYVSNRNPQFDQSGLDDLLRILLCVEAGHIEGFESELPGFLQNPEIVIRGLDEIGRRLIVHIRLLPWSRSHARRNIPCPCD